MRSVFCFFVTLTLLTPTLALADEPGEELQCLIGTWTGDGEMSVDGATHPVHLEYTCRAAGGGAGVACHLVMTGMGDFTYESDDLWGYDPGTGHVHWFTVTNAGETHDHDGRLRGNAFVATYLGRREGQPMRENVRFEFQGRDRIVASSVVFVAHQRQESLSGTMTREAPRVAQASRR